MGSLCSSSDKTTRLKFLTNLTPVNCNFYSTVSVCCVKLTRSKISEKEMEKNRTKLLTLLQNNNPICKSNNSQNTHTVFRGQIRTLTSYQSEVSPRTISGSENHYMDILMS